MYGNKKKQTQLANLFQWKFHEDSKNLGVNLRQLRSRDIDTA